MALRTRRSAGRRAAASASANRSLQVPGVRAGPDLLARAVEHGPRRGDRERIVDVAHELIDRWQVAKLHEMSVKPPSGYFANRETSAS